MISSPGAGVVGSLKLCSSYIGYSRMSESAYSVPLRSSIVVLQDKQEFIGSDEHTHLSFQTTRDGFEDPIFLGR